MQLTLRATLCSFTAFQSPLVTSKNNPKHCYDLLHVLNKPSFCSPISTRPFSTVPSPHYPHSRYTCMLTKETHDFLPPPKLATSDRLLKKLLVSTKKSSSFFHTQVVCTIAFGIKDQRESTLELLFVGVLCPCK